MMLWSAHPLRVRTGMSPSPMGNPSASNATCGRRNFFREASVLPLATNIVGNFEPLAVTVTIAGTPCLSLPLITTSLHALGAFDTNYGAHRFHTFRDGFIHVEHRIVAQLQATILQCLAKDVYFIVRRRVLYESPASRLTGGELISLLHRIFPCGRCFEAFMQPCVVRMKRVVLSFRQSAEDWPV